MKQNKVPKNEYIRKPVGKTNPYKHDVDYVSRMGYRDDSPFNDRPYIDIHTPSGMIDMSNTGIPLIANGMYLPPYSGMHQFEPGIVREQKIPMAQDGLENKVNKWLGEPMNKAQHASKGDKWFNPKTKKWERDDDVDNFRHPMAGRYTAEAIANKFPSWMQYTGIPQAAGFVGANALGIGHEITNPNQDPNYSWWDVVREAGEDIFNNAVGAGVGVLPMSDDKKTEMLWNLSKNNRLPDGYAKANMYFKAYGGDPSLPNIEGHYPFGGIHTKTHTHMKEGGWLDQYQTKGEVKPIYVTDPNDYRLRAYNDSLWLHQHNLEPLPKPRLVRHYSGLTGKYVNHDLPPYESQFFTSKKSYNPDAVKKYSNKFPSYKSNKQFDDEIIYPNDWSPYTYDPITGDKRIPNIPTWISRLDRYYPYGTEELFGNNYVGTHGSWPFTEDKKDDDYAYYAAPRYAKPKQPYILKEPGKLQPVKSKVIKPSMTKDKSGRPIGIIGQTIKDIPKALPNKKEEAAATIAPDYLPMIQTGMPDMISREPEIIASPTPRPSSTNNRISWRMDPETRKMVPVYLEGKTQKVKEGKRLYNKNIPSSTAAIPADFVPQFEPDENKDVVSKQMGGWLDKYQDAGQLRAASTTAAVPVSTKAPINPVNPESTMGFVDFVKHRWNTRDQGPSDWNLLMMDKTGSYVDSGVDPFSLMLPVQAASGVKAAISAKNIKKATPKSLPKKNIKPTTDIPIPDQKGINPLAVVDNLVPRLDPLLFLEDGSLMDMSPLNLISFYGKSLKGKDKAFRKFGNTLEDVIKRKSLSPKGGSKFRMGKDQIVNEGNWAALNRTWEKYPGTYAAEFDFKAPGSNLGFTAPSNRSGVLITDAAGNRLPDIPVSDPGLQFHRRLPFSTRYVPIDKEKLINNEFQLATQGSYLQSLAEKYGYGLGAAASIGLLRREGAEKTVDKYNEYTIDPIINFAKKQYNNVKQASTKKEGGWLDQYQGDISGSQVMPSETTQSFIPANLRNKLDQLKKQDPKYKQKLAQEKKFYDDVAKAEEDARKKEIADRKARIANSIKAQDEKIIGNPNWREVLARQTQATGDKLRISDEPNFFDDYVNPAAMIGSMATGLGQAPYQAQQQDSYMPYLTGIGMPLAMGALAGLGAKSTGQFINNIVNPLAGLEQSLLNRGKGVISKKPGVLTTQQELAMMNADDLPSGVSTPAQGSQLPPPPSEIIISPSGESRTVWQQIPIPDDPPMPSLANINPGTYSTMRNRLIQRMERPRNYSSRQENISTRLAQGEEYVNLADDYANMMAGRPAQHYPHMDLAQNRLRQDELFEERNRLLNEITTGDPDLSSFVSRTVLEPAPQEVKTKIKNISGLTQEDALAIAAGKDKDKIAKMSETEFKNTVLNPNGEIITYKKGPEVNNITYDMNTGRMVLRDQNIIPNQDFVDLYNSNIARQNEIIASKNKSGVQYRVKDLKRIGSSDMGYLTFETPEQIIPRQRTEAAIDNYNAFQEHPEIWAEERAGLRQNENGTWQFNEEVGMDAYSTKEGAMKALSEAVEDQLGPMQKISGESVWAVDLYPGKWQGNVEDIANQEYYKSIPGLGMHNTMATAFADKTARRGSKTYEAINDYLKEMGMGRVKPGFNSQTEYSLPAWEDFVKKGKAFGYYGDPKTVYGSMRSMLPYLGLGYLGYEGMQDDGYRRGGSLYTPPNLKKKTKSKGTSKNIQSSINSLFARNFDLYGSSNKAMYNPNSKYKFGGGWLDNLD